MSTNGSHALKLRAVANGRSVEAEHREILRQALDTSEEFKRLLAAMPAAGDDDDFARVQDTGTNVDL